MKFNPRNLQGIRIDSTRLNSGKNLVAAVGVIIFAYEIFQTALLGDDAGFTIRAILNFVNGYGPVSNVGESSGYWFKEWSIYVSNRPMHSLMLKNTKLVKNSYPHMNDVLTWRC